MTPSKYQNIEPPYLLAQECSAEEYEALLSWNREKVLKRLDAWKNGMVGYHDPRQPPNRPS
jgi:hypothetical protein